jgi:hypothetical protein
MQIFQQEYDDGIADTIMSTASISYASIVEPSEETQVNIKDIKSLASLNDKDLYYVKSILVTSSWNKNDDIFDKKEIWLAKDTPEDKPTNLEHDESLIIGHITANWPITEDGLVIDENTDINDLPDKYHILTGSVIYKGFSNQELRERAEKLIAEIENGTKYVSMECYFKEFDYGIINNTTGEYKILSRNNDTAYLTKYLRAYGGSGEHNEYKIGRVLKGITFSGKGFVDKPANPDSIIFGSASLRNNKEKNDFFTKNSVSIQQETLNAENNTMSLDLDPVLANINDIKNKIEAMEIKTSESQNETIASLENTIKEQNDKINEITLALENVSKDKQELVSATEAENAQLKSYLLTAQQLVAEYKSKEEEMMKKEKKMKRMASLIEAGLDQESAASTTDKFEDLNDDMFDTITSIIAAKMPSWLEKKKEEKNMEEKKKASENTDTEILENVEVDNTLADITVGGTEDASENITRAELVEFVCARLGKKLNKGE